jgi:hypothetical protein
MVYLPGSSRIRALIITVTGGYGPQGATGPTGNTGNYITGPDGFQGFGVTGFTYNSVADGLTFYIEGVSPVYLTGFKGNTGDGKTLPPPFITSIGAGVSFVGSSGYTLFFRSITFSSGISASISGDFITIQENSGDTGSFDKDRLLFVGFADGNYFIDSSSSAVYNENVYSGITYANLEITRRSNRDLFGVENFNYSTGSSQNSSHYGMTMTIDSVFYGITGTEINLKTGIWNPYLKYKVGYYDLNGVSGSTFGSISFLPLGPYTKQIKFDVEIGSCCYCDDCDQSVLEINGRKCEDYVLRQYCDQINGRWSKLNCYERQNTYDCYRKRACCVNGTCINTSEQKCSQMNGQFCRYHECGVNYTCGDTCAKTDELVIADCCCCKNGIGTPLNCESEQECINTGGTLLTGSCSDTQGQNRCCGIAGACCKPDGTCTFVPANECVDGIFHGLGVTCGQVNCCNPI